MRNHNPLSFNMLRGIRFALLAIVASATIVPAATIIDNTTSSTCECGFNIDGTPNSNFVEVYAAGANFTPTANYDVTGAAARLYGLTPANSVINFAIYSDANGVPGTLLTTLGSAAVPFNSENIDSVNSPSTSVELFAGTQYWLVLTPNSSATNVDWEQGGVTPVERAYTYDTTTPYTWGIESPNVATQFAVYGNLAPAPEPATLGLLCVAAGLATFKFRKHNRN